MKEYVRKVIYIIIFILADIVIFAMLALAGSAMIGKENSYCGLNERTFESETYEYTAATETTTEEHSALYEKSSSPLVNWMRNVIINIRG